MAIHGVNVSEQATSVSTPSVASSGIPFVVGAAPVHTVGGSVGKPVLITSYSEGAAAIGYSDAWMSGGTPKYTLCEFLYSHFKLFGMQPVIFYNVLNPDTMYEAVAAADLSVSNHQIKLSIDAIDDANLVIKAETGTGDPYVKGTDYDTVYSGEYLVIELLSTGACYSATKLNVAHRKVDGTDITASIVSSGFEGVEECLTTLGIVPDLLCAPGWSSNTTVAAAMATKAAGINGMFKAKALIDISTAASGGADVYSEVSALKTASSLTDENEIVCWPLLTLGNYTFHMSTQLAGLIAQVDTDNDGCPYESPANKSLQMDGMTVLAGTEINLTLTQANILNAAGVVTALNFMGGYVCWGSYTACYPNSTDVKDYFIPVSRMFDWVGNTLIQTFWSKLDMPMNRRLIDSIMSTANIWLNGLTGSGYLLGARAEFLDDENPLTNLMAGIIKIHIYMTPPSPTQEIDFVLEYDADYVTSALSS